MIEHVLISVLDSRYSGKNRSCMTLHSPNSFQISSTLPSVLKNLDSREVTSAHLCVHVKSSVVLRGGSESLKNFRNVYFVVA